MRTRTVHPGFAAVQFPTQYPTHYPIGQVGGCNAYGQAGGFALPGIAAIATALKTYKPFTRGRQALDKYAPEAWKNNGIYRGIHGVARFGEALGIGQIAPIMAAPPLVATRYVRRKPGRKRATRKKIRK